jgi:nucleoside triphosphate diphosphatase
MPDRSNQPEPISRAQPALQAPPRGETAGEAFASLVELMRLLRSPEGCPWDREQTLESLAAYVLEEAYEVTDAIERRAVDELKREIGDLVFEGVFLSQVAADEGHFTIVDALNHARDKLVRRHPHVFAPDVHTASVTTPAAVKGQWEEIKAAERGEEGRTDRGVFDGLPRTLPALLLAYEASSRAALVGFDWPDARSVLDKIEEELAELRASLTGEPHARVEEETGDLLFAVANLARKLGVEPEIALRRATHKFQSRFVAMQQGLAKQGLSLDEASLDEMEAAWQAAKQDEQTQS